MGKLIVILVILLIFTAVYFGSTYVAPKTTGCSIITPESVPVQEAFQVPDGVLEEIIGSNVTYPSGKNPFMNVLLDEIKYNPTRAPAASVLDPSVNVTLADFFKTQFVNDPTDVFGKTQSQRQFYTMPSTSVPNDQGSYQDWLYKIPGKTCKEGGFSACMSGTDGGPLPWLNHSP